MGTRKIVCFLHTRCARLVFGRLIYPFHILYSTLCNATAIVAVNLLLTSCKQSDRSQRPQTNILLAYVVQVDKKGNTLSAGPRFSILQTIYLSIILTYTIINFIIYPIVVCYYTTTANLSTNTSNIIGLLHNQSKMATLTRADIATKLKGIERYNPENMELLVDYLDSQCKNNHYDLEANLAILKLYQFNPGMFQAQVVEKILLKALTNLPHPDFILCKCLIEPTKLDSGNIQTINEMHHLLELCQFRKFWVSSNLNESSRNTVFQHTVHSLIVD